MFECITRRACQAARKPPAKSAQYPLPCVECRLINDKRNLFVLPCPPPLFARVYRCTPCPLVSCRWRIVQDSLVGWSQRASACTDWPHRAQKKSEQNDCTFSSSFHQRNVKRGQVTTALRLWSTSWCTVLTQLSERTLFSQAREFWKAAVFPSPR